MSLQRAGSPVLSPTERAADALCRPDWPLLLPPTPFPNAELEWYGDQVQIFHKELETTPPLCHSCYLWRHGEDGGALDPSHESSSKECSCEEVQSAFLRELYWPGVASLRLQPEFTWEMRVLRRLKENLETNDARAAALATAMESSTDRWTVPFFDPRRMTWKLPPRFVSLSRLVILTCEDFDLDDLSSMIGALGTLRVLQLRQHHSWKNSYHPESLQRFISAVNRSNIDHLDLSEYGYMTYSESSDERCTDLILGIVDLVLDGINSKTLRTLQLMNYRPPELSAADRRRFHLAVARFIRRSIRTESYKHPAMMLNDQQVGAPNLRNLVVIHREAPYKTAILAAALIGTTISTPSELALPPSRSLIYLDAVVEETTTSDSQRSLDESLDVDAALRIFHPRTNPLAGPDLPPELVEVAHAHAVRFVNDVNNLADHDLTRKWAEERLQTNRLTIKALEVAAFQMLGTARALACQIIGKSESDAPSPWLDLPSEIRFLILSACDEHGLLSHEQRSAVIAFGADRRTLGFGRVNELFIFPRRLRLEEVEDSTIDQSAPHAAPQVLPMVPVQWSWRASLEQALPADWSDLASRAYPQLSGAAQAFLAVTGCCSPLVDRDA